MPRGRRGRMSADAIPHGTNRGYHRHGYIGTPYCDECRAARREYDREKREIRIIQRECYVLDRDSLAMAQDVLAGQERVP